jgi:hypothetical protein
MPSGVTHIGIHIYVYMHIQTLCQRYNRVSIPSFLVFSLSLVMDALCMSADEGASFFVYFPPLYICIVAYKTLLLRGDCVNSVRCYGTPATYTYATIDQRGYATRFLATARQTRVRGKYVSTIEGLCFLCGPHHDRCYGNMR